MEGARIQEGVLKITPVAGRGRWVQSGCWSGHPDLWPSPEWRLGTRLHQALMHAG